MIEKGIKLVVISTAIVLVGTFLFTMVKVAPNIETSNPEVRIEEAFSPTKGEVSVNEPNDTSDETDAKTEETSTIEVKYFRELKAGETSYEISGVFYYEAKEVESSSPPAETGRKNLAFEFIFEILDDSTLSLLPIRDFTLVSGEKSFSPSEYSVLEAVGWERELNLHGILKVERLMLYLSFQCLRI